MAKKMPDGVRFKPGESGNKNGRPPVPPDLKEAKKLNRFELERLINKFLAMGNEEIKLHMKDPKTPMLELMIGSIIAKGVNQGDEKRLNFILERLIGKVATKVTVEGAENGEPINLKVMSPQEKMKEISEVNKVLGELGGATDAIKVSD